MSTTTVSSFLAAKIYPAVTKMKEIIEGQCLDDVPVEEAEEAMEMELAGPSEETETPAGMATDPEEGSGLLSILMDAIEESENASETVCEAVLRGDDPEPLLTQELLANWPLDMLSAKEKTYGIIPLLEDEGECLELYRDTFGLTPRDFFMLEWSENKLLGVGVAMLWGWIPAYKTCQDCSSPMKLYKCPTTTDNLLWRCTREVPLPQRAKSKAIKRCEKSETPRKGTWLFTFHAQIEVVMLGIFYWCAQRLKWDTIGLWCGLSQTGLETDQVLPSGCSKFHVGES